MSKETGCPMRELKAGDEVEVYSPQSKIMTDFLGKNIHIGDKIVYCRSRKSGFDMIKTEVIGFTKEMVKVPNLHSWEDKEYSVVSPGNCIVYKD